MARNISGTNDKRAAISFVNQGQEYFSAARRAASIETKPLLYYYSFLNLGKAVSMALGRSGMTSRVTHGIADVGNLSHTPNSAEISLQASGSTKSAVDELYWALEGCGVQASQYPIREVTAHSAIAHRMWREGWGQIRKERFVAVENIRFFEDASSKEIWTRIYLRRDDLKSIDRGIAEVMREARLDGDYRAVTEAGGISQSFHVLEQILPTKYTGRAADVIMDTVKLLRPNLWQINSPAPTHRRYYLYLSPQTEKRMPQWLSIYATLFWLGSLTRYYPVDLLDALEGPLGPFLREFLETQPNQLLYTLASCVIPVGVGLCQPPRWDCL
jgi:hypothetical protein